MKLWVDCSGTKDGVTEEVSGIREVTYLFGTDSTLVCKGVWIENYYEATGAG